MLLVATVREGETRVFSWVPMKNTGRLIVTCQLLDSKRRCKHYTTDTTALHCLVVPFRFSADITALVSMNGWTCCALASRYEDIIRITLFNMGVRAGQY